jgi:putative cell wall-binding protein
MRARTAIGALVAALAAVAATTAIGTTAGAAPTVTRIQGESRYATAAAISAFAYDDHPEVAYITTGTNFPDALAAAPVAAKKPGPVLLVRQDAIPQSVQEELFRLRPETIVVLGGPAAVSERVVEKLQDTNYTQNPVIRVAGADRYETAAKLSAGVFAPGVPVAYVATGTAFADALSGGAAAGAEGGPMLLVRPGDIPATTANELDRLNPAKIVVLGGTNAVSPAVQTALASYSGNVVRRAGADRYETSVAISAAVFPANTPTVWLATGQDFPDALAAGAPAALTPAPVLLSRQICIPNVVDAEIDRLNPSSLLLLGGANALSDSVAARGRCGAAAP